jgi:hypothetical protein
MPQFKALLSDFDTLRRPYWYDKALTGGLPWWEAILDQVASAEIFVAILSESSLRSVACQRELQWALDLRRKVLPIQLEPVTLPSRVAAVEVIDYCDRHSDPDAASACMARLGTALAALDAMPAEPLPQPRPTPPALPESYGSLLGRFMEAPDGALTLADQREMLVLARGLVTDDPSDQHELSATFTRLSERKDTTWETRQELEALIERLQGESATEDGGLPPGAKWKHAEFTAPRVDLWKLAKHLQSWYETQRMQVDIARDSDGNVIVHTHSAPRARWTGAGAELVTILAKHGDSLSVSVGGARWKDKAASAGAGLTLTAMTGGWGWPLLAPSVVGTYRQTKIADKTLTCVAEMLPLCNRD